MTPNDHPRRIWIVQNGEELPTDPGKARALRQSLLANELAQRGHEVTYWAPSFNHQRKVQRQARAQTAPSGYQIQLLPSRAYSGHLSVARILSHRDAARSFTDMSRQEARPDLVLAGYPTIELAAAAVSYAQRHGIPSIVDLRDQWPDIIAQGQPRWRQLAASPLFAYWRILQRKAIIGATAVGGITDEFINWGLSSVGRERGPLDRAFHLSPPPRPTRPAESVEALRRAWREELGGGNRGRIIIAYAGNLGHRTDILTVARAVVALGPELQGRIRVVICGVGGAYDELVTLSHSTSALHVVGWKNGDEVHALLAEAHYGVIPYLDSSDFLMSYPNKLGELLSYGLPVLNSLGGIVRDLLKNNALERRYDAGDVQSCASALRGMLAEPPSEATRDRARSVFRELFDPSRIYPSYADHVLLVEQSRFQWKGADRAN